MNIDGKGFGTNKTDIKVYIGMNPCKVKSVVDDKVVCTTSSNKEKKNNQLGKKVTVLKGSQKIENHEIKYEYYQKWSDLETWKNKAIPTQQNVVVIGKNRNIVID